MIKKLTYLLLLAPIFAFSAQTFAQTTLPVGGAVIYNFQTRSVGIEVRTEYKLEQFDLLEGITLAPQISYFPWFNNVHEFYFGSNIQLGVYNYKDWIAYGLVNLSYNGWINHSESASSRAKFSNVGFEMGGGITNTNCIRPFIEYRYNFKWREGNIRAGAIYTFNCNKRGMVPCPKIPKTPSFDDE